MGKNVQLSSIGIVLSCLLLTLLSVDTSRTSNSSHTDNWAVLVSTSTFWLNYRHVANVLSVYRIVKRLGIPDSRIILMLPENTACNPRNMRPGEILIDEERNYDVYGKDVQVDYRGNEVNVENFMRVLTGESFSLCVQHSCAYN
jgi:phosphatidylinositol glycan class K